MSLFDVEPRAATPLAKAARRVEIYFDGGCRGNPGQKYGSFQVKLDGKEILKRSRVTFGHGPNNEAEFKALKLALDEVVGRFQSESILILHGGWPTYYDHTEFDHVELLRGRGEKAQPRARGYQHLVQSAGSRRLLPAFAG